ncbi:hypothetical protein CFBP1590__1716 [Pseudomonas viridiflava]|uniref:Uncharacterized protein n=1 Tax=Pseudomonas viridiflava TaxID=33069 RepID=A0A1Y6JJL0_PSEVI|nr:hypothetical protein CFBP1590__1716 [Pseudomonas viridiflava]VVO06542.1 hypothetical protein PS689_03104 [Pseudomonas fluorescens]
MRGSFHANIARPPDNVTGIKSLSLKAVRYLSMLCCAENEIVSFERVETLLYSLLARVVLEK